MYHKWDLGNILHHVNQVPVTYIVASFSEAAKTNDFLSEREEIF